MSVASCIYYTYCKTQPDKDNAGSIELLALAFSATALLACGVEKIRHYFQAEKNPNDLSRFIDVQIYDLFHTGRAEDKDEPPAHKYRNTPHRWQQWRQGRLTDPRDEDPMAYGALGQHGDTLGLNR